MQKKANKPGAMYGPLPAVILTFVIFFGAQVVTYFLIGIILSLFGWDEAKTLNWFEGSAFAQLIFSLLASSLVLFSVARLLKLRGLTLASIGLKKPHLDDVWRTLIVYVCYLLGFIALTAIAKAIFPSLDLEQEQFNFDQIAKTTPNLFYLFISLVILPPIMEEILTRGFLYTGLRSKLSLVPSTIITSIIFAVAHLQFGSDAPLLWIAALDTFVLSLALVYLREKTGRLAAPIMLHGLKNAIAFCLLFFVG